MLELTDTDRMPFGKYQGKPMQDVPASYFHWLWIQADRTHPVDDTQVIRYIRNNLNALKEEHPDGIWS